MLEDTGEDVQGVALYAEWKKPDALSQIFVTPDGFDTEGAVIRSRIYRRTISVEHPRKQWRSSTLFNSMYKEEVDFSVHEKASQRYVGKRISSVAQLFRRLHAGGWIANGQPIYVEISRKDMDDISKDKSPNKFLYRVDLVKKSKGIFEDPLKKDEE